jgi:2'-5' RNA ligase
MPPRCFIALTLPESVVRMLVSTRERFLADAPGWTGEKWVATHALHVTLAFLGDLDDRAVEVAAPRMIEAASRIPSFDLRLTGVAPVPSPRSVGMLWATLGDPDGRLTVLRDALMTAFPQASVDARRPLRPHITLVRTRSPRHVGAGPLAAVSSLVEAAGKEPGGVVSVRSATLFSSTLRSTGPEYREIAIAHLGR